MSALFDPAAHEPLTATAWDERDVRAGVASIVTDAEGAVRDAAWPTARSCLDADPRFPAMDVW